VIECHSLHALPCGKFNGEIITDFIIADLTLAGVVGGEKD
tara:strand:- start:152 stop:271 length:120 start_codon:yes stop_codon:yes gene_type:complete